MRNSDGMRFRDDLAYYGPRIFAFVILIALLLSMEWISLETIDRVMK